MDWRRTLAVMFTAQLLSAVGFSTIFPFLPNYVTSLHVAPGSAVFWVTAVFSVQAITMAVASPLWGAVADRRGRKLMVERALFGGAIVILAMAFVHNAAQLVALRAVQGMVTGVNAAAASLVAATAPRKQIGYAMGLMQTAQWAGVSVGPIIGSVLDYTVGDRLAFVVTAALLLVGAVVVLALVREDFEPSPSSGGLPRMVRAWAGVVRTPGVRLAYLVRFTAWLGRNLIVPFLPLFVAALMADGKLAGIATGVAIGLASFTGTLSAIYLGRLGDRIGHKPVLAVSALATAVFYLPMAAVGQVWQLLVLNALVGAAVGGVLPSISALLAQFTEPGEEGSVYGLDNAVVAAARAVAPVIGGGVVALLGLQGAAGYRPVFVVAAILFVVTGAVAAWRLPDRPPESAAAPAPERSGRVPPLPLRPSGD